MAIETEKELEAKIKAQQELVAGNRRRVQAVPYNEVYVATLRSSEQELQAMKMRLGSMQARSHTRLDSFHEGSDGLRVDHEAGTLVLGSTRRFVFRWNEQGRPMGLSLRETDDGTFVGELEYPGSLSGDRMLLSPL
ncbi:hypothetical protein BE11_12945 [Sorangium cellulosum]|nr:hypothetical protein BE11_12945 [Sorangium cellulosum]